MTREELARKLVRLSRTAAEDEMLLESTLIARQILKTQLVSKGIKMTKEEIQLALQEALKESKFWEQEASMAEDEMRAAEEMCLEWYKKFDKLTQKLEKYDKSQ